MSIHNKIHYRLTRINIETISVKDLLNTYNENPWSYEVLRFISDVTGISEDQLLLDADIVRKESNA